MCASLSMCSYWWRVFRHVREALFILQLFEFPTLRILNIEVTVAVAIIVVFVVDVLVVVVVVVFISEFVE